ncbi:alpha/beta fold hydrolase [Auritidibacter ignavus]|uniref:alpha/beta fold hydrolase n=2 Tax=Auritidibacter ignavus TaxID=678932 RepID=UPI000D73CEFB|nr:pimeloyl-ACP methyl ester carboxylesterase [Auritidibacter ignavus]PXA75418.1 alpha/beta hydrolase [Auritidibacter sp. NML120779]RMX23480.1 alpha/beta hydrolase [Auritidibacter ignavus]
MAYAQTNGSSEGMNFCFLHGIGGTPQHFDPLVSELLTQLDRDTRLKLPTKVPVSELKHWNSLTHGREDVGLLAAVEYIARQVDSCDVLVGHSTGGVVALQSVAWGMVAPRLVVIIDSNAPVGSSSLKARERKANLASQPDWRQAMRASLARDWDGPAEWKDRIFNDLDRTPDLPMRYIWNSVLNCDSVALWKSLNVRGLYIRSTRSLTASELAEVNDLVSHVEIRGGHWPHVSKPATVATAIRLWL